MLTKAQQETIRTLAATLARAPHGGRRGLVAACADQLGVSIPTVYRALKDAVSYTHLDVYKRQQGGAHHRQVGAKTRPPPRTRR